MNDKRPHYDGGDLRRQGYRSRQDSERLTSRDKMQPVLLDMLTDDEPQKKQEAQVRNLVSHSELRRRVLRDLQWLFNCVNSESNLDLGDFPQVRRSTLNYGIASLAGKRMSDIEWLDIQRALTDSILHFEPRILPDGLQVRCISTPARWICTTCCRSKSRAACGACPIRWSFCSVPTWIWKTATSI